jgi:prolyl-tRNA synthetase
VRMSDLLVKTRKEAPADAELVSHKLLVRAGYVQRFGAGIYALTPLGLRTLRRIEAVVREEMEAIGGQELLLPLVQPADAWQRSGRYDAIDDSLLRFTDRTGHRHVLAMTHEETATALVADIVTSYRQLPLLVFQIQLKFRDELRPRGGLIRLREFLMKDAYSFHASKEDVDNCYAEVAAAYRRIFQRLALPVLEVEADTGIMGGAQSREFTLPCSQGEDRLLVCGCGYAANSEVAPVLSQESASGPREDVRIVETPGAHTIADLCAQLDISADRTMKAVFCAADEETVIALVRGDREVCLAKLQTATGASVRPLSPEESRARGLVVGFAGPVGLQLPGPLRIVLDAGLLGAEGMVAGANQVDCHLAGVSVERDIAADVVADIALARVGDSCPMCGSPLAEERGIEVGNIFKLGTFYSRSLGALATGADGHAAPMEMASYGIGITRLLAAIVEAHHDDRGIAWPHSAAPYAIHLIAAGDGREVTDAAEQLYHDVGEEATLYDDRAVSAGVKFQDADLLGMPLRVTVGSKSLSQGAVEIRTRAGGEAKLIELSVAGGLLRRLAAGTVAEY